MVSNSPTLNSRKDGTKLLSITNFGSQKTLSGYEVMTLGQSDLTGHLYSF